MENYDKDNREQDNHDSQNAEEFTDSNANFNQNLDHNDRQNSNPDMENKRLDTDPNRYSNFNTNEADESAAYEASHEEGHVNANVSTTDFDEEPAYITNQGDYTSENELEDFAPDDDRRLTIDRNSENEKPEDRIRNINDEQQQFFDGL